MKRAVIIGAGQSGRGYVARFLNERHYHIDFIDKKKELVQLLKEDASYRIHFYRKDRSPFEVNDYDAFDTYTPEADEAIRNADLIFVSVGEQNLGDVACQIRKAFGERETDKTFITAENGINPARVFRNHLRDAGLKGNYAVSQTAIFCSTLAIKDTRLDVLSQNEWYFPYDCDQLAELDLKGAVPVHDFEKFFQRKIYTYNCIAGLISYTGYVRGYEIYGEAANDPEIYELIDRLLAELNPALQQYFNISEEDQISFAERAKAKMVDKSILDYVIKNGRAAARKLGPTERIMKPMNILREYGRDCRILQFVAACALVYWEELQRKSEPLMDGEPIDVFCRLNDLERDDETVRDVERYLTAIRKNRSDVKLLDTIYG